MKTKIEVKKYRPIDNFTMNGLTMCSCYLNQYFEHVETGEIIHACYTDYDDSSHYERVIRLEKPTKDDNFIREISDYLGMAENCWQCIFDDDYPNVIDGYVELDTERC